MHHYILLVSIHEGVRKIICECIPQQIKLLNLNTNLMGQLWLPINSINLFVYFQSRAVLWWHLCSTHLWILWMQVCIKREIKKAFKTERYLSTKCNYSDLLWLQQTICWQVEPQEASGELQNPDWRNKQHSTFLSPLWQGVC